MDGDVSTQLAAVGAFLVEPRIVRRVIRRHRRLRGRLEVLHPEVYTLPRADLLRIASARELGVDEAALPEQPILIPRPANAAPAASYWRRIFHARVHQALEARGLTEAMLKQRIHRIGQTELDEIRFVLRQDDRLLPPRDNFETYVELAAMFLELTRFAPDDLGRTFPSLSSAIDRAAVEAILAEDIDVEALLEASRPAGAPPRPVPEVKPVRATATVTTVSIDRSAAAWADEERRRGNLAHAIVLARRAADPAATRDLETLVERMPVPADDRPAWQTALLSVVDSAAASAGRDVNQRFLYDLQKAVIDNERGVGDVDVLDSLVSLGARPMARALPLARPVRIARHLRHAAAKLSRLDVSNETRARLAELVHRASAAADFEVRFLMQPPLEGVLDEVGLRAAPDNLPEKVARRKLVAELLDRVVAIGWFNLGHLRDAISRNGVKLADLSGPLQLVRGDALLTADRRLAQVLDGVYRRGEIYLRLMQKLSSLFFGTAAGRFLTLYALLPFVGAFVVLEGLQHMVEPPAKLVGLGEPHIFSWPGVAVLAAGLFALLHSQRARRGAAAAARAAGRGLHAVFVGAPRAVWRSPPVQALVTSPPAVLFAHYVFKPAIPVALIVGAATLAGVDVRTALIVGAAGFLGINLLLNSRTGRVVEEIVSDWLVRAGRHLGKQLLPGLFRLIVDAFRLVLELVDRALYTVDERLRFRQGDGPATIAVKGVVGSLWGLITYVVRIYVNLFIEPTVNPIKHFPVVTVAGKIMLPLYPTILAALREPLTPLVGTVAASSIAGAHVFIIAGFWGFLVWELKENWRLYAANRPRALDKASVGEHGETMGALLVPGLHSGTVPKLYARLRRAARRGADGAAARQKEALHHVERAVRRFVEREMFALLEEAGFRSRLRIDRVEIGGNRLRVHISTAGDARPAIIVFEEQSGWLLASVAETGFAGALDPAERDRFDAALTGLYKRAGVDLLREQLAAELPAGAPYDIADEGLVVWSPDYENETVTPVEPRFARERLAWEEWGRSWSRRRVEKKTGAPRLGGAPAGDLIRS